MRDHIARRPMPVEQSILWKPLRDPHYVVASLQPADGGRRKIFVRQQVLARVEALVQAHGRRTLGLLVGQLLHCSTTGAEYLVVESTVELNTVPDETQIASAVGDALNERAAARAHLFRADDYSGQVLGWYRGVAAVEPKPSMTTAGVHVSLFNQPWQMALVVGERTAQPDAAVFLRDSVNSCWFLAPFYELLSDEARPNQPKATVVNWPQYMTAESTVFSSRDAMGSTRAPELAKVEARKPAYERPWLRRSSTKEPDSRRSRLPDVEVPLVEPPPAHVSPSHPGNLADRSADSSASERGYSSAKGDGPNAAEPLTDRPLQTPVAPGVSDGSRANRERPPARRGARIADKLPIVDDREQRMSPPTSGRRVSDDDDTVIGDNAERYIEVARAEGFFIAAKFDALGQPGAGEQLWILNEPYSGLLLTVVATPVEVIDATLHYNIQTDDEGLKKTPFPEHRDPESKTIYVRETCVDWLRARCRRLRATNTLLKEWRVTPRIQFVTPEEWESVPMSDAGGAHGANSISTINNARIAELPTGLRTQFHLDVPDATAP